MSENYSKLMTMKEARSFLPVSNTTIRRWVDEGLYISQRYSEQKQYM